MGIFQIIVKIFKISVINWENPELLTGYEFGRVFSLNMQPMLLFTELLLLANSSALLLNKKYLLGEKPKEILIENQVNENNFNH